MFRTIDLSLPDTANVAAWSAAMERHGFAIVINHAVPEYITNQMYKNTLHFFQSQNKTPFAHGVAYGLEPGFTPIGIERVDKNKIDNVESLIFINSGAIPDKTPDSMKSIVPLYWSHMLALMNNINRLSAVSLNLPPDYFTQFYNPGECALRLAHYPPTSQQAGAVYGAHTDYTGFTLLRQDEVPGLEVMVDSKWIPVPFVSDSFVINSGDLIQRWTNDRWISNIHHVVPNVSGSSRYSMVFFTGPSTDTVVAPLDTCVNEDTPSKYAPIIAGEHLKQRLDASNNKITV